LRKFKQQAEKGNSIMKKIIAMFAILAAASLAQAQGIPGHPDARNDRMPSTQSEQHAEHHDMDRAARHGMRHAKHDYHRADRHHAMKHRKHHRRMHHHVK
jgi:hypothetical protein